MTHMKQPHHRDISIVIGLLILGIIISFFASGPEGENSEAAAIESQNTSTQEEEILGR